VSDMSWCQYVFILILVYNR